MAKKKNGWMERERNRVVEAEKANPPPKKKPKLRHGHDVISEFCPKCDKPKDKRRAIMGDYANPERCQKKDCPLKDPFKPKDTEGKMRINIGGRTHYSPSGPFQIKDGKIKSMRRRAGIKKKNKEWLEVQEAKKKPMEADDGTGKEA